MSRSKHYCTWYNGENCSYPDYANGQDEDSDCGDPRGCNEYDEDEDDEDEYDEDE